MRHCTTFRGVKVNYDLDYVDGLPFADILEVSNNGQVLDLSVDEREKIKYNIYGYLGLSELFERLNNHVSANYWRANVDKADIDLRYYRSLRAVLLRQVFTD